MLLRILVLWLLLCYSYSKADCLPDTEGLCTPGVTVTEDIQVEVTEEDLGTEIVTTTTTTTTTTTQTVTNQDSGDILDGSKYKPEYVQQKVVEQPTGDNNALKNFGLMALSMLLLL